MLSRDRYGLWNKSEQSSAWKPPPEFYFSPKDPGDQMKRGERGGTRGACGGEENTCGVVVGRPASETLFGKPRLRWKNNISMVLKCSGRVWIGLMWLRIRTSGGLLRTR